MEVEFLNALLTTKQVAQVLKVSPNRVGEYVKNGFLHPIYTPPRSDRKFTIRNVNQFISRMEEGSL